MYSPFSTVWPQTQPKKNSSGNLVHFCQSCCKPCSQAGRGWSHTHLESSINFVVHTYWLSNSYGHKLKLSIILKCSTSLATCCRHGNKTSVRSTEGGWQEGNPFRLAEINVLWRFFFFISASFKHMYVYVDNNWVKWSTYSHQTCQLTEAA